MSNDRLLTCLCRIRKDDAVHDVCPKCDAPIITRVEPKKDTAYMLDTRTGSVYYVHPDGGATKYKRVRRHLYQLSGEYALIVYVDKRYLDRLIEMSNLASKFAAQYPEIAATTRPVIGLAPVSLDADHVSLFDGTKLTVHKTSDLHFGTRIVNITSGCAEPPVGGNDDADRAEKQRVTAALDAVEAAQAAQAPVHHLHVPSEADVLAAVAEIAVKLEELCPPPTTIRQWLSRLVPRRLQSAAA